jgi:hypothetical protein
MYGTVDVYAKMIASSSRDVGIEQVPETECIQADTDGRRDWDGTIRANHRTCRREGRRQGRVGGGVHRDTGSATRPMPMPPRWGWPRAWVYLAGRARRRTECGEADEKWKEK